MTRKEYYEKNKYRICNQTLNCYCIKSIQQIKLICPETVGEYLKRYPFEEYAESNIKKALNKHRIFPSRSEYADCYDAGMLAYLYSVHRCAVMRYEDTEAYIKKMIRIYIICAIIVYGETNNICRENGLREVRLNAVNPTRF